MTWKEKRIVTILLSIITVLFAALLIVLGVRYRAAREAAVGGAGGLSAVSAGKEASPQSYTAISYYNGSATLSFALDEEGSWIWADDPDFPLDDITVAAIVDELSGLHFQQTLPAEETMETYGFTAPSATLTATSSRGTTQTLVFGKTTTDGDSYYLQMNGDESTVYIVADTLCKYMSTPIYSMCVLPRLPDLSEANLLALSLQGPVPAEAGSEGNGSAGEEGDGEAGEPAEAPDPPMTVLSARRAEGEGQTTLWFRENNNVTSNQLLRDLLEDLAHMSFLQCVDYRPSEDAEEICGFDAPDAVLTVGYSAGGTEQTLTLAVGARLPDGSGRYVQLGDSSTIYSMSTDDLDPLMYIAANGLES